MPPRKKGVRPPTLKEAILARQAQTHAKVDALRQKYLEPVLLRFPVMLPTKPDSAARYAIISSILWFAVGLLLALLLAVKLVFPKLLARFPWMSYGRLTAAESAVMTWGVLFTGFVAAMFIVVPRVCRTKLWSERIGAQTVILLDQVVLAGVVLLLIGRTQGIPGAELIWPIDILLLNVMVMVAQNVVATVVRRNEKQIVPAVWHYLAALLILPLTYGFGNLAAPWYFGVNQQIVAGFGVAGTIAALMLMGVGTAYYVLPKASGLPIYSERLALMGFWTIVFAGLWVGQASAIFGPGQDYLETVAITFAVGLIIAPLCVLVNFWSSLRGAWEKMLEEPAVRFVVGGTAFLFLGVLMFGIGSLRTMQNVIGHTTWDIAQRTALLGGLGMFFVALVYYQLPRMTARTLFSARWAVRHFWMTTLGLAIVVLSMAIAGAVQGYLQSGGVELSQAVAAGDRWLVITRAIRPLFILRIGGGALVAGGLFLFVANLLRTSASGSDAAVEQLPAEDVAVGASA